jgi:hypothetical protein
MQYTRGSQSHSQMWSQVMQVSWLCSFTPKRFAQQLGVPREWSWPAKGGIYKPTREIEPLPLGAEICVGTEQRRWHWTACPVPSQWLAQRSKGQKLTVGCVNDIEQLVRRTRLPVQWVIPMSFLFLLPSGKKKGGALSGAPDSPSDELWAWRLVFASLWK